MTTKGDKKKAQFHRAAQVADPQIRSIQVCGACASSLPVLFSSMIEHASETAAMPYLFVLDDAEEAGYFYHDLTQILGENFVFYYPSSYRRAIKFAQKDSANEILRTEVLSRLQTGTYPLFIVTYPEALAEKVVSRKSLQEKTLRIRNGECIEITEIRKTLIDFGFKNVDYVYEPGQFAIRGSIVDIFSFSSEYPFRVDFFGNEVDSIRSFDVQTQLSQDKLNEIAIVPELQSGAGSDNMPFTDFLPEQTMLVLKDLSFVCDSVEKAYREGFSQQAILERQAQSEMDEQEIYQQMKRECQLVERDVFVKGISRFRRIECAATVTGTPQATVRFEKGMRHIWTRILSIYGPYDGENTMVMSTIYKLLNSEKPSCTKGEQMWDFLYSKDAALAMRLLGEKGTDGRTYCIGSGKARPLKEYIDIIGQNANKNVTIGYGDIPYGPLQVMYLCADITALREDTGFEPRYSFEDGIKETIEWCRGGR